MSATGVRVSFVPESLGGGLNWVPKECPYLVLKERAHMKTESPDCKHSIDDCISRCGWFVRHTVHVIPCLLPPLFSFAPLYTMCP